ncbi:MAG: Crp/Fnr family transcriptional regulator [Paenibacillaceae bacterium]
MLQLLQKVSLFSSLTQEQLTVIAQHCARKSFRGDHVLFLEKDNGAEFYIVMAGSVKIYTSSGGEDKILSVFKPGDSFGELSLLDGKPRSASAATLENSVLLTLDKVSFLEVLRTNFDIAIIIMQELCQRLRDTNQHVHDLTFLDSRTRVLKHLIQTANKHGVRQGTTISLRIVFNYDEIARMAGVQKDTFMQVIRELQVKQILYVTDDGFTLDLAKLRG